MTQLVTMFDTIGADYTSIPVSAEKIAVYVTGSGGVLWPPHASGRFPRAGKVRTDQSPDGRMYALQRDPASGRPRVGADCYDMEQLAGTAERFAQLVPDRHDAQVPNCGYGTPSTLEAAARLLDEVPGRAHGWWHEKVDWWLANPNLDMAQAAHLVGTVANGFVIRSVQWATPATNPDTKVPGGTLKSLNLDLSIADAAWFPSPPQPPVWPAQAMAMARDLEQRALALQQFLGAHQ